MSSTRDCLIVGGGVIGLSLAYDLACHGLTVTVVERSRMGAEASWAGAGMLPPASERAASERASSEQASSEQASSEQAGVHPLTRLQALSHRLHAEWAERLRRETGIDTGYRRCGAIYVARTPGEAASLIAFAENLREELVHVESLSGEQLAEIEPGLRHLHSSGQLKAAIVLPDEAQLRNPRHLQALVSACRKRGVDLREDTAVEHLSVAHGRLREVVTTRGPLTANRVCLAAGAWTYELLQWLDIPCGVYPVRGQMIMFRCERPPLRHIVNEGPRYLVPRDDGRVLVGSTEEEVGFDKSTTPAAIADLRRLAGQIVPELERLVPQRSWAGLRPASYDGFPYMGKLPGLENAFVAAGHFRSGLTLSTGTAVVMGRLIRGEDPQLDLSPFRAGRG